MKWITREHPKIDRIACPWLIYRFIDDEAEIIFVPSSEVKSQAEKLQAIPFDVPGVEYTHYEDRCTFDYFVRKHAIADPAVHIMADIVRGADTDLYDFSDESAGLWAISAGLAYNYADDRQLLEQVRIIYDALYSWAKYLHGERHTANPSEKLLLDVFNAFLKSRSGKAKKMPAWAKKMKEIIQDQIDTTLTLSLKEISRELEINPAYLSREFSKYFDHLNFGEYIRKLRIDKARQLITATEYSFSEISYLTGFSDQSHFTRTFRSHTGETPSAFRKRVRKSNISSKR